MKLTETIVSHLNRDHVYGNAGDDVKVICVNGNTAIVEAINKSRFPVSVSKITDEEIVEAIRIEPTKEVLTKPIIKPVPKRGKTKASPAPQNTLFS